MQQTKNYNNVSGTFLDHGSNWTTKIKTLALVLKFLDQMD